MDFICFFKTEQKEELDCHESNMDDHKFDSLIIFVF